MTRLPVMHACCRADSPPSSGTGQRSQYDHNRACWTPADVPDTSASSQCFSGQDRSSVACGRSGAGKTSSQPDVQLMRHPGRPTIAAICSARICLHHASMTS
ncbi:hypothetical protein PBRA_009554 [Plasmodiophora brassicae]|uniref:Uncharacterized protein n=1 Tax=Plasmodiophora brassicae TaxID=37360 RepID=A0A0G4J929_PLABS|nr:hypothetical protein PBRA_009554 [Plasmodiophora brassicae]